MFLDDVISQYIDDSGKTRVLNYDVDGEMISIMVSPIVPLSIKEDKNIYKATLTKVIKFIKAKNLQITYQNGVEDNKRGIQGIWVETTEDINIVYGYIPVKLSPGIKGVEYSDKLPPLLIPDVPGKKVESEMEKFRKNRKIAEILKEYVLYTYSLYPDDFNENYFVIDPDHTYDINQLNKRLYVEGNDIIYRDGYIVVNSEDIRDRLMSYLKVNILNNLPGILEKKNKTTIDSYYQTIMDFRNTSDQLIFVNKSGLLRWTREGNRLDRNSTISPILLPNAIQPYYYRTPSIENNKLLIIQNVEAGSLEKAITVSYKWIKDKVNIGYNPDENIAIDISKIKYKLYTQRAEGIDSDHNKGVPILEYETEGKYAAILVLPKQ